MSLQKTSLWQFGKSSLILTLALSLWLALITLPAYAQEPCPDFPIAVSTETELNTALACFNALTTPGVYTISLTADILLSAATLPVENDTLFPNMTYTIFLLIEGNGHTVDGQGIPGVRPFTFNEGFANEVITLQNLTITGGNVVGGGEMGEGSGGGIKSDVPLILTNITLLENQADYGGGLYVFPSLFMQNSAILSNTSIHGGGGIGIDGDSRYDGVDIGIDATAIISSTLFQGNEAGLRGGAIRVSGELVKIYSSDFIGNRAQAGGAIHNQASVTIYDSVFSGNIATSNGGAIHNEGGLAIYDSAFSGNTAAGNGGGLYNGDQYTFLNPSAHLFNSTFSANTANQGGGIYVKRKREGGVSFTSLNHVTLSGNTATIGGGLYIDAEMSGPLFQIKALLPGVNLQNSIVANSAGGDCFLLLPIGFNDLGYNLVEDGSCIRVETSLSGDPLLGPLADNGGATPTHALLSGSPAIDAGEGSACLAADQRGMSRPQGGHCDIGAFELDTTPPVITPTISGAQGDNGWYTGTVSLRWTVSDESAISSTSGCSPTTLNSDTAGATLTCEATSEGGSDSASVTLQRDATPPMVSVTGVTDGASYELGAVPAAGCDTQDGMAGVAVLASLSLSGGDGNGLGIFTATCTAATDKAGNTAAPVSVSYTVTAAGAGDSTLYFPLIFNTDQ